MTRFFSLLAAALLVLGLSACAAPRTPYAISSKPLMNYNYTAIDQLMSRAGKSINKTTPMLVGTIGDVNNVEKSSTLGRTITEQLSARLAQKGYKVAELKLRQGISIQQGGLTGASGGEYLLSRDVRSISGEHKAAAAVTGTYSVGADSVLVNLRLLDIRTGNVITGYDYVLPKTADVSSMTHEANGPESFFGTSWTY